MRDAAANLRLDQHECFAVPLFSKANVPIDNIRSPVGPVKPAAISKAANPNASAAPKSSNWFSATRLTYCSVGEGEPSLAAVPRANPNFPVYFFIGRTNDAMCVI